jgi:diguanylate cyclase
MTGAAFLAALLLGVLAVGCAAWYRARFIAAARLSRTDDLTGLGNRRALLADLGQALADGGPLSLMLLDLDGFKAVNDLHGHGVGDQVLRLVGGRLGEVLGAGPRLARLGGDEFAVVVLDDDLGRLLGRAERVRAGVGRPLRAGSAGLQVQVSVGATVRSPADVAATDLLVRADLALYRAKAGVGLVVEPAVSGAGARVR